MRLTKRIDVGPSGVQAVDRLCSLGMSFNANRKIVKFRTKSINYVSILVLNSLHVALTGEHRLVPLIVATAWN